MLQKTKPFGHLLLLCALLELAEQGIDRTIGDGDGKITFLKFDAALTLLQAFTLFLCLVWSGWLLAKWQGKPQATGKNFFEQHAGKTMLSFLVAVLLLIDFGASYLYIKPLPPSVADYIRSPHPYYHHTLHPLRDTVETWGFGQYRIRTNSLGLKDAAPVQVELRPGKPRLLLIGDSFTEGVGLPFEHTFAGILRDSLPQFDVQNAGVVSYSPKLDYLKVRFLVEQLGMKVDQVLMLVDISDIYNETTYQDFAPTLPAQSAANASENTQATDAALAPPSPWQQVKANVIEFLDKNSTLGHFVLNFKAEQPAQNIAKVSNGSSEVARWTFDPKAIDEWGREGLALAQQNVQHMADFCKQRGIGLTLVVYPWPDQIRRKEINSVQVKIWHEMAQKNGLRFANLFPDFIDNGLQPEQTYERYFIKGDVHWNHEGNQVVARKLISLFKQ